MMRKAIVVLLVGLYLFGAGSPLVLADGMLLPEALSPDYLVVRNHHVTVTIEDQHAITRVEQEFYNPYDVEVTSRYLFPVPPDAILSHFEARVDGQRQAVTRQDATATNADLNAVVARQHDPSLLQYAGWESLAFDLSLPPGGSRAMSLEYEEVLAPSGGLYHYRYVLSTERYSSLPLEEASVIVDVHVSSGLASLYSPNHRVQVERRGPGRARVTWKIENANPTEDFEVFFAPADGGFGGGLLTGERNGKDHLLFLFSPEVDPDQGRALPKDIVFVVDRSGSMSGEKLEQARNALRFILTQLGEQDRFSVVSFDEHVSYLAGTLQTADPRSLKDARRYVDQLSAGGSTDLEAALRAGLEILEGSESRGATRMVVTLTDGLPTAGITDADLIAQVVREHNASLEARLHVFGVGYDVNTHLLDRLAADHGGTVTYVQPGEDLEVALTGFYGKIAHPLLTDLQVAFEGLEAKSLYPETLPDLFQGSSLLLTGRYHVTAADGRAWVRVRGWAGDERREYVYRFDLDETGGRDFVPRLWATRRVGALLDRVRVEGESQALVSEIRELGLDYGIVTPYTAFAIEGQAEGAASAANMAVYDSAEVNQAWGEATIRARVQNQMYQEAAQANLATGANVSNYGQQSLAQVGSQQVDLSLLRGGQDLDGPITTEWIEANVEVNRTVEFGSEAYFALAADPEARAYLQSGSNVVFAYQGEVIAVHDPDHPSTAPGKQEIAATARPESPAAGSEEFHGTESRPETPAALYPLLITSIPCAAAAVLLGFMSRRRP